VNWTWRFVWDDAGSSARSDVVATSEPFPSRSDAETWLGEQWRELRSAGVEAVQLIEGDQAVGSPLRLEVSEDS
jgi:hypothetical protein